MTQRLGWAATVLAGVATLAALSRPPVLTREDAGPHVPPLLPRKELLHLLGASVQPAIADYFWLQTIQQTGRARNPDEYRDIYDYADLTTDLDPDFAYVYVFAGPAVTFNLGRETWVNTDESTRIMEKGFARFKNIVLLRVLLAYNYSYFHGQYQR